MGKGIVLITSVILLQGCGELRQHFEGPQGPQGNSGSSCTVYPTDLGNLIECPDGSSVLIKDGKDGQDGISGVISRIDPCGKETTLDEVLLKMTDGTLLAYFQQGNKRFLAELGPGNYVTTDGTNCNFTVHNDNSITW